MSVEELIDSLESAGFHVHRGMRGQITWKGNLLDRLTDLSVILNMYYDDHLQQPPPTRNSE